MTRLGNLTPRYRFVLNPYPEERFPFCPDCHRPTEERKFPLFIHVYPRDPFCINKTCRYCPSCDLLIAHQDEVEEQLALVFQEHRPELAGHDYLVMGTLDTEVWARSLKTPLTIQETRDNLHDFKIVQKIERAGAPMPPRQPRRPGRVPPRRTDNPQPRSAAPERKPGRNDPCWCGSGKKYKSCHMYRDTP